MQRPYRVGRSCQAWCLRCKSETEHLIIAMVEDLPKRVECCSCHGQHNYRLAPAQRKPSKTKTSPSRQISPKSSRWEKLLAADDSPEAKIYSMTDRFEAKEVVEHQSLGTGIVQQVRPGNKIEVLFKSGTKLLVHGR